MIQIIADSGSTKTNWCIINGDEEVKTVQTVGLNPFFIDEDQVLDVLKKDLYPFLDNKKVSQVYFYGSGCGSDLKKQVLQYALDFFFMHADVEVENDLLGASRALSGYDPAIVCILGTGSSSCIYDHQTITERLPSLGYVLGDEGSGAYFGKLLISEALKGDLPSHLSLAFNQFHGQDATFILDHIYRLPFPNRYLATFMSFIVAHKEDSYIRAILHKGIEAFFKLQILRYKRCHELPIHFCGSVSHELSDLIRQVGQEMKLNIHNIESDPLAGLIRYHFPKKA